MTITKINISIVVLIVFVSLAIVVNTTTKKTLSYALTDNLVKMYALNDTRNVEIPFVKGSYR
jgi:hypothetical protein